MSSSYILYSGEASSGLDLTWGDSIVLSGGTAVETKLADYASMCVMLNGLASATTVNSGGSIYASFGILSSTTVNSGGTVTAAHSAAIADFNINSGGSLVTHAGNVTGLEINSGGTAWVYGGTVNTATVHESGSLNLRNNGTTAKDVVLAGSGYSRAQLTASNGAILDGVVASAAFMQLNYDTIANDIVLNQSAQLSVSAGASAAGIVVNAGGSMYIEGSAHVDDVTVNQGGYMSAGFSWYGTMDSATVVNVKENGGQIVIGSSGGYNGTPVIMYPVAFASNTFSGLTYSGGWGTVHSGTSAIDITAIQGGLIVYEGGVVSGFTAKPTTWTSSYTVWEYSSHQDEETGAWIYTSSSTVSSAEVTTVGGISVLSGGTVTALALETPDVDDDYNSSYMEFQIAPGTVIDGTLDGNAFVTSLGVLENATVRKARMTYMDGAQISNVTQIEGSASVLSGAAASELTLSGTYLNVSSGGSIKGLHASSIPYTYWEFQGVPWGDPDEYEEVEVEGTLGATVRVSAGAVVTGLEMDSESHLYMEVAPGTDLSGVSGGVAIEMHDGYFGGVSLGSTYVQVKSPVASADEFGNVVDIAGGTVSDLIANMGAVVNAEDYTTALNMTENGGAVYVGYEDEQTPSTVNYSFNSNTFSGMVLQGETTVHKNTVSLDNILQDGSIEVFSGGSASGLYTVGSGMHMAQVQIDTGAIVRNFDVTRYAEPPYHGGHVGIQEGAYISGARLSTYDFVDLGVSTRTVILNGSVDNKPFSIENGVLSGYQCGGMTDDLHIYEGASVIDSYLVGWGSFDLDSGTYARNIVIDGMYTYVKAGAILRDVQLGQNTETLSPETGSFNGADVYVSSGGVVRNVSAYDNSTINIYSGATLTGEMRFNGPAYASVSSGGIVDFDLTDRRALDNARLNNFQAVDQYGSPKYTITVSSDSQAKGAYTLANNAFFTGYKNFYVNGDNGEDYGYFEAYYNYDYEFMCHFVGNAPSGFMYSLSANRIDRDDGVLDFDLVFTVVESPVSPAEWRAAPTVTADTVVFTNSDVVLTIDAQDGVTKEYSLNGGDWAVCGDTFTVSQNGEYFFRVTDGDLQSEATSFRVSNIDKVAPTPASDLSAAVEDSTVFRGWTDATDDFSGVAGYSVSYWMNADEVLTLTTPWKNIVLESMASGTWNWTVKTYDYAGNMSEAISGGQFVVTNGYVPRLDLPDFFVGDFNGSKTDQMLTVTDESVMIYVNGAPWNGLTLDPGWELAGVGDFNADGRDDLLRINAEGYVVGEMTPDSASGSFVAQVLNFKNAGWDILGTGDFNGNGSDDILIANPTGASETVGLLGYWESGVTWTLINGYSAEWEMIATGDFNKDGKCDMLWRNSFVGDGGLTYNAFCTWIVEDPVDWRMVSVANPAEWNFLCAGDFDGDKMNDIAMINDVGVVGIWGVENGWLSSWSILSAVDTSEWKLVGVGDFNGDGTDDIGWCSNISGLAGYWQIEDKTLAGWQNLASLA